LALAAEGNNVADRGPRGPLAPEDVRGPHGPRTSASFYQRPAPGDAGPDIERPANDDGWPGDGTGLWGEAGVTEDRARGGTGDAGDGLQPPPQQDGLDVAREALRIFEDDLTDESAARLRAVLDGTDGYEWGGLA
jgi:hypothetical protein